MTDSYLIRVDCKVLVQQRPQQWYCRVGSTLRLVNGTEFQVMRRIRENGEIYKLDHLTVKPSAQ